MKSISKNRFLLLAEVGAVTDIVFPLKARPYAVISGKRYTIRGLNRRGLLDFMEK